MSRRRQLASIYARLGRTYWSWAPALLPLAVAVFVPLGLLGALAAEVDLTELDVGSVLELAVLIAAIGAVTTTSLVGEVFYSGAIAVALTAPDRERAPSAAQIARRLDYGRLIAVDLLYVLAVALGVLLFVVTGLLAFVWFALAGPVVEIEGRSVGGAFRRSWQLVRGNFLLVLLVLGPVELVGEGVTGLIEHLVHGLLGDSFFATWMAEAGANIVFAPVFAIAAVLLTLDLIAAKDASERGLARRPAEVPA
jgi:hypothetical protein